jgi:hypothetical protein
MSEASMASRFAPDACRMTAPLRDEPFTVRSPTSRTVPSIRQAPVNTTSPPGGLPLMAALILSSSPVSFEHTNATRSSPQARPLTSRTHINANTNADRDSAVRRAAPGKLSLPLTKTSP